MAILRRIERGAFAAPALAGSLASSSLSKQDKGLVTELVYGTLRYAHYLDACLAPWLRTPHKLPAAIRWILRLGSYEKLQRGTAVHALVHEWVEISKVSHKRLAGLVNAVLRKVELPEDLPMPARASVSAWLWQDWCDTFGEEVAWQVGEGMLSPARLWLQCYHTPAVVQASLEAQGCSLESSPIAGNLAVTSPLPLTELEAFVNGWVQPQNPASSFVAQSFTDDNNLPADLEGACVLDLCSGSGIKAAQLAAQGAQVTSVELHADKLARATQNLARLGLKAKGVVWDMRTPPPASLGLEPAPYVLLDAPCSGTGTLRSHPEIRLRLSPAQLRELVTLQKALLDTAAHLTQVGGQLIYAVCALTRAESSARIRTFLAEHDGFELVTQPCPLPHHACAEGVFILPYEGVDGFFLSHLRRIH